MKQIILEVFVDDKYLGRGTCLECENLVIKHIGNKDNWHKHTILFSYHSSEELEGDIHGL